MQIKKILLPAAFAVLLLLSMQVSGAAETATIHGAVYEWDSFDPLEHVIIEVNSTPPQSMLANYGVYSFNLTPGNYTMTAKYYADNELIAYTEEEITIMDDGDYVMDLILLPVYYDASFNDTEFAELDEIASLSDDGQDLSSYGIILILLLAVVLIAAAYYFVKQRAKVRDADSGNNGKAPVQIPGDKWQDLPDDLRQVIAIIAKNDGRITQKELRTKVKHSEAKVSLMISDLESRGIVRKFKKGRGNIIILEDNDDSNQNV